MKFLDLVQILQMTIKALMMYTDAHPRSQQALGSLTEGLHAWLAEKPALHIAASNGKLFVDSAPLEAQNLHTAALAKQLGERQIAGFIIQRGVEQDELLEMLNILILKPSKLEQLGGAAKIMADKKLRHISLGQIQYKEVREGDNDGAGDQDEQTAPSLDAKAVQASQPDPTPLFQDIAKMLERWKEGLETTLQYSALLDGLVPSLGDLSADLAFLAPVARDLEWGNSFPTAPQLESLRQALHALPGRELWSVMAGIPSLPADPAGLGMAFQALAPEMVSQATSHLLDADTSWSELRQPLVDLLAKSPQQQAILSYLNAQMGGGGLAQGQVQELVRQVDWNQQSLDEKVRRALMEETLWELNSDQRLELLRNLLELEQFDSFLQILERILDELTSELVVRREEATHDLAGVTEWMRHPGLPLEIQGPLIQGLTAHFGWEPVLAVHRNTTKALEHIFTSLVAREEFGQVRQLMEEIEGLCSFIDDQQEWRGLAMAKLRSYLSTEELMAFTMNYLHGIDPEKVLTEAIPYFEFLGEPAARYLVKVLGDEPDRRRRGRLLDIIRVMGPIALPAVIEGLSSPTWYFVRNTLNLLADMGDAGMVKHVAACLTHGDGRVRASAVRALWKLGGPAASAPLVAALPSSDPETQLEILFGLGQIQAPSAVPGIAELARQSSTTLKVRLKAVEALGQIASPTANPTLLELLRRKGRIFTSAEPTELRVAAARAMLATASPQADLAVRQVVADEPRTQDRDALQRILDLHKARS